MKDELENVVKKISEKYNKKEKTILLMLKFLKIKKYNVKESRELIEEFLKRKKPTALLLH